mgnify:CR=1 FL=1
MKIYGMYGWDFPTAGAQGPSGFNTVLTPIPNTPFSGCAQGIDTQIGWTVDVNGWFVYNTYRNGTVTGGPYRHRMMADWKTVVPNMSATSNIFVGCRFQVTGLHNAPEVMALSPANDGLTITLFLTTDLPAYAINKAYYLEYQLDFANSKINRWVNGSKLSSITMQAWMLTAVSATPAGNSIWHNVGANGAYNIGNGERHQFSIRDMYVIEWDVGEVAQPLGAQTVTKLAITNVAAATWTPSTGTATSVLKTGYSNPSTPVALPTLTTDDAMTPASITYDASAIPLGAVINGVLVKGRSAVTVNATGNLGVSLTVGGIESPDTTTPMVAAQTWYDRIFAAPKTPAGNPWYQPNLAGLTVKLKPKV